MEGNNGLQYNLTCSTKDGRIADWIASQLRKRLGSEKISAEGISVEPSSNARVLTIIYDPFENPPYQVLELAKGFARQFGVEIVEADIIGDISLEVVLACAGYALSVPRIRHSQVRIQE